MIQKWTGQNMDLYKLLTNSKYKNMIVNQANIHLLNQKTQLPKTTWNITKTDIINTFNQIP